MITLLGERKSKFPNHYKKPFVALPYVKDIFERLKSGSDCSGLGLQWTNKVASKKQLYQHKKNIRKRNRDHSALCKHVIDTGHKPLWDNVEMLYHEINRKKRDILGKIAIKKSLN